MSRLKLRLEKLEKTANRLKGPLPSVVIQEKDETEEEAIRRTYGDRYAELAPNYVLLPAQLSESEWVERYSPPPH